MSMQTTPVAFTAFDPMKITLRPELVYASSGGVGHGRNDLAVGPDNLLYSIHGDSVDLPESAIDHTSPYRNAAKGIKTSEVIY